jgi:dethiobiotin synthetase
MRPFDFFITGTDTEIGKTFVTCALLHAYAQQGISCLGMKPIAAGAEWRDEAWHNEDVDQICAASSVKAPLQLLAPYLMRTPAAPHIVAKAEQVEISLPHILASYRNLQTHAQAVLVEGAGGFIVPIDDQHTMVDLAQHIALPVILVVGLRLGCINHALLSVQAIAASGLRLAGWVANTVDANMLYLEDNVAALTERIAAPCLGVLPRLASPELAGPYLNLNALN